MITVRMQAFAFPLPDTPNKTALKPIGDPRVLQVQHLTAQVQLLQKMLCNSLLGQHRASSPPDAPAR